MRIDYLPEDIRTIHTVATWLYREWGHVNPGSTLETAIQRISQRAGSRIIPLTLVAFENGSPVGTASLVAQDMKTRMNLTPWLSAVYVLPNYRRLGIGTALCRRAVLEVRRLGFGRIYLITGDRASFYQTLGWKEIHDAEYHKNTVTIMSR